MRKELMFWGNYTNGQEHLRIYGPCGSSRVAEELNLRQRVETLLATYERRTNTWRHAIDALHSAENQIFSLFKNGGIINQRGTVTAETPDLYLNPPFAKTLRDMGIVKSSMGRLSDDMDPIPEVTRKLQPNETVFIISPNTNEKIDAVGKSGKGGLRITISAPLREGVIMDLQGNLGGALANLVKRNFDSRQIPRVLSYSQVTLQILYEIYKTKGSTYGEKREKLVATV